MVYLLHKSQQHSEKIFFGKFLKEMGAFMRTFLKTEIPLAPEYEDAELHLWPTKSMLTLRMLGGLDTAVTQAPVGIHKPTGERITARLEFTFRTDIPQNRIEINANGYRPELSTEIILLCGQQKMVSLRLYTDDCNTPLLAALQETMIDAQNDIRGAALDCGISVGQKFALGPYEDKYFVLRNGRISHIFDPEYDDFDACETSPITSHYHQVVNLAAGETYVNVIGSSGDRYPATVIGGHTLNAGSNWMNFWSFCVSAGTTTDNRPACCYYNAALLPNAAGLVNGHRCNAIAPHSNISGNHSLRMIRLNPLQPPAWPIQNVARRVAGVSNVYIIAACANSNHRPNNSFIVQVPTQAVQLRDYYLW